ncbi:hypothetical protein ARC90_01485 [Escherichia coli]|nr:hypothetical protein ARC90_01485 [Escherichia coli]KUH04051.1 hypothetical protein ARC93_01225 [Escherichia coli]
MVVQLRIRFGQPPPRILFVGRQRLYAVIRAVNGFQVAAGMVRQFKPDPVGVTDTRDSVLMAPSVSQKLFIHDSSWFCFSSTYVSAAGPV